MSSPERITELIRDYANGPRLFEEAVAGIPEDELRFRPGPEHWSIHENVVHLGSSTDGGGPSIVIAVNVPRGGRLGY